MNYFYENIMIIPIFIVIGYFIGRGENNGFKYAFNGLLSAVGLLFIGAVFKEIPWWLFLIGFIIFVVAITNAEERKNKDELESGFDDELEDDCENIIKTYLTPYVDQKLKFKKMKNDLTACEFELSTSINLMDYSDFLKTYYWHVVSYKVKKESNYQCSQCGSPQNLEVHHKDYDNHGKEHLVWKTDLICLCTDCHSKMHSDDGQ